MRGSFTRLIEQVPEDVFAQTTALIGNNVAFFKPRAFIVNKVMCTEDYNIILPSSPLPPARVGKREHEFMQSGLVIISSGLQYYCTTVAPTLEYISMMINKDFVDTIALDLTGHRPDFSKIDYAPSSRLLRIVADLEDELTHHGDSTPEMLQAILIQLVIQLLRDSGLYTSQVNRNDQGFVSSASLTLLNKSNEVLPVESRLTEREIEVAVYLLERFDYDSIAQRLYISPNTLKTHAKRIYRKLNVSGRKELGAKFAAILK